MLNRKSSFTKCSRPPVKIRFFQPVGDDEIGIHDLKMIGQLQETFPSFLAGAFIIRPQTLQVLQQARDVAVAEGLDEMPYVSVRPAASASPSFSHKDGSGCVSQNQ